MATSQPQAPSVINPTNQAVYYPSTDTQYMNNPVNYALNQQYYAPAGTDLNLYSMSGASYYQDQSNTKVFHTAKVS